MDDLIVLRESALRRIIAEVMAEKPQEEKIHDEILLTTNEACEFLRCSKPTLHRWKKEGIVPHIRIGANIRYRKSDLQKIAEN